MKYFGAGMSELHKELNTVIRKQDEQDKAKILFLDLHAKLHLSEITSTELNEVDTILTDLSLDEYEIMPTEKDETIAWALWHLARIEDLTMNFLVAEGEQIFNPEWKKRLNAPIDDTGNALTDDEIMNLSKALDINALIAYRNAVGKRTREIVNGLSVAEMNRKVPTPGIEKIRQVGGVTKQAESLWLLDYWSKKDVAGILLMPPTRHAILHLNDCGIWKSHMRKGKKCFRSS
jgi:hypothetical protein